MTKTYVIAEAGVNHNGSLALAKKLVDVAADSGADAVKFQTFKAGKLATSGAQKADYQVFTTGAKESQLEMLKKLELSESDHVLLIEHCKSKNITFLSTPFDMCSLDLLVNKFGLSQLKISSGDLTDAPLLLAAAKTGRKIILSTGMSNLGEVEEALSVLAFGYLKGDQPPSTAEFAKAYASEEAWKILNEKVSLLHCTTEYPAPLTEINLQVISTLRSAFGLTVGYSDHSEGITIPIAAVALGAKIIEKHFTIDRSLPGPDQRTSLEPGELERMIRSIREVEIAFGKPNKGPTNSEMRNKAVVRKSLRASCDIQKGEILSEDNLTVKRPGDGVSPVNFWDYLGRKAVRGFKQDEGVSC